MPFFYTKVRRLLPVRSPLLRESHLMSFPRGTEMFHFSRFASLAGYLAYARWVSPFRYRRITGYCRLPDAFRRLSRLSSPLTAKASTMCTSLLDYTTLKGRIGNGNDLHLCLRLIQFSLLLSNQLFQSFLWV